MIRSAFRLACRRLRRRPLLVLTAVGTLAVAIAAHTTMFSVIDAVLLRPLPYPASERLVVVGLTSAEYPDEATTVSFPEFREWREASRSFAALAALPRDLAPVSLGEGAEAEDAAVARVSQGFFEVLGLEPAAGRFFTPNEDLPGADPVVVLSHETWQRRYAGATDVIGRRVRLNEQPHTVVGVAPPGLAHPPGTDLWVPLSPGLGGLLENRAIRLLEVLGRLRPGVSVDEATAEIGALHAGNAVDAGSEAATEEVVVVPLRDRVVGDVSAPLTLLFAAVSLLFLAAGANVTHLFLLRALDGLCEVAVRAALGARLGALAADLLIEGLLVSVLAGAIGLLAAQGVIGALLVMAPAGIPRIDEVGVDARAAVSALGLVVVSVAMLTVLPLWQLGPGTLSDALRRGGVSSTAAPRSRLLRGSLVVSEVAIAAFLLVGGSLVFRSLAGLSRIEHGFRPDGLITFRVWLPPARYPDPAQRTAFLLLLEERIGAIPGVERVGVGLSPPLAESATREVPVRLPDVAAARRENSSGPPTSFEAVTPGYFRALGVRMERGRSFAAHDRSDRPIAIVNRALAERLWADDDPLGRQLLIEILGGEDAVRTVVGVVADVRHRRSHEAGPAVYVPFPQNPFETNSYYASFLCRTGGPPGAIVPSIREAVADLDPQLTLRQVIGMDEVVEAEIAPARFQWRLIGFFALFALVLALSGLFSIVSYSVAARRRELGLRTALGAGPGRIMAEVLQGAALLAAVGTVLGLASALAVSRAIAGVLYGVSGTDPVTFTAVAVTLLVLSFAAVLLPAFRATRTDPASILRVD